MPDPIDAICERCGNRYDFLANAPGRLSPRRARTVATGLKKFVMTDGQSFDGAMSHARDDAARREFARAAVAFQETFNFCFTCRRSVCPNCWNGAESGCLDCALPPGVTQTMAPRPMPIAEPSLTLERSPGREDIRTRTLPPDMAELVGRLASNPPAALTPPADDLLGPEPAAAEQAAPDPNLRCHNCDLEIPPRARFCRRCGLQITRWSDSDSGFSSLATWRE